MPPRPTRATSQGQLLSAQANLRTSQINLGYTTITAPIDGKIGRTNVTAGNVVGPGSGTSWRRWWARTRCMWCFPISVRSAIELRQRYVNKGGFGAVQIKIVLPDGRTYGQTGKLNFVDNTHRDRTPIRSRCAARSRTRRCPTRTAPPPCANCSTASS